MSQASPGGTAQGCYTSTLHFAFGAAIMQMSSSVMPFEKYSSPLSAVKLRKGSTATDLSTVVRISADKSPTCTATPAVCPLANLSCCPTRQDCSIRADERSELARFTRTARPSASKTTRSAGSRTQRMSLAMRGTRRYGATKRSDEVPKIRSAIIWCAELRQL
jgi:hypothetical protein